MEAKKFYTQLALVTVLCTGLLVLCYTFLPISEYVNLGIFGLVFFVLLSILIFTLAERASTSKSLNAFTRLIMYNLMIKLFMSFAIVIVYYYIVKPVERLFILPYIVVYLVFTIFEAVFLSRQARTK